MRPGPDPGRHGPPLPAPAEGRGAGRPIPSRGAARGAGQDPRRAAVPGAGDADRHRRRRLHARRGRPAAPRHGDLQPPGTHRDATARSSSSGMARARLRPASSPSAASSRSRASATTASRRATPPASRCWSTSRPGSNATTRPCSAPRSSTASRWASTRRPRSSATPASTASRSAPVDVNDSDWDCTLEPLPRRGPLARLRLGLRADQGASRSRRPTHRHGAAPRPYRTLEELQPARAACAGAPGALAEADAFRSLGLDRRAGAVGGAGADGRVAAALRPRRGGRPAPTCRPSRAGTSPGSSCRR